MWAYGIYSLLLGLGATIVMDLWALMLRHLFGVQGLNYAMVGRWVGHMPRGTFAHDSIARAEPVRFETALGWGIHYATGILFAAILALLTGPEWMKAPTLLPALAVGVGSIVAPFFIMQPAFGLGIAGSKTPSPLKARLRSLMTHTVFGFGLYIAARGLAMA